MYAGWRCEKRTGRRNTYVDVCNGISGDLTNVRDDRYVYSIVDDRNTRVIWWTIMTIWRKRRSTNNGIYVLYERCVTRVYAYAVVNGVNVCNCTDVQKPDESQQPPHEAFPRSNWKTFCAFKRYVSNVIMYDMSAEKWRIQGFSRDSADFAGY